MWALALTAARLSPPLPPPPPTLLPLPPTTPNHLHAHPTLPPPCRPPPSPCLRPPLLAFLHPITFLRWISQLLHRRVWPTTLRPGEVALVIKLGGSALTDKTSFETVKERVLQTTALQLRASTAPVIVHGAGSFGHFQAHEFGVARGAADPRFSWLGFSQTRASVSRLHTRVVSSLVAAGLPAVGLPPFPHWRTREKRVSRARVAELRAVLAKGLLPVLHGDAVFTDEGRECGILSGDELCRALSEALRPRLCVFLASVAGVFDRPPEAPHAKLIRVIRVDRRGRLVEGPKVSTDSVAHDVTGGLRAKLEAAVQIARLGVPVCICEGGTGHAAMALQGRIPSVCTMLVRSDHSFPEGGDYLATSCSKSTGTSVS
ncbi:hypothetical protein AB1Y20_013920 [Prymnesium parvum]|uniref:Isopentenyl phosphate kinase n=1 Tax=Prymnesium parvum TaxID=97485 RepID=A0AB34IH53_PRYPA